MDNLHTHKRLITREVHVGDILIGGKASIKVQTMTTTDTMDTHATVQEAIRCIEAGSELIRITAPSQKKAQNLANIKNELRKRGYNTPLVADIHFTPNAANIAATIVEKVRINPGNYVDKKKFQFKEYTDQAYKEELEKIEAKFIPFLALCKKHKTAIRIGTNHGSLSDRIMSRYGDTSIGMVESVMEFLHITAKENFHQIVLSMKSSNPKVMIQAYRELVVAMEDEFGICYPLHLGVTEAGDGEDGRIKSAIGIGALLEQGIGDTIRVSLTEDSEKEIPVCKKIVYPYHSVSTQWVKYRDLHIRSTIQKRHTRTVGNIGGGQLPIVIADVSKSSLDRDYLLPSLGYTYDASIDKWHMADRAPDYIYTEDISLGEKTPTTLGVVVPYKKWSPLEKDLQNNLTPTYDSIDQYQNAPKKHTKKNMVIMNAGALIAKEHISMIRDDNTLVLCTYLEKDGPVYFKALRSFYHQLNELNITTPCVLISDSKESDSDAMLIHYAIQTGALLIDGIGDGICLGINRETHQATQNKPDKGDSPEQLLNNIAFAILQATRTRISKTEYIACPSCGRTLFDLQLTTKKVRKATHHLKGLKIAVMGCIVNGPGEMADADFGYVGSGENKITLYKGKEVMRRNIPSDDAVSQLVNLIKESGCWVNPTAI